VETSKTIYSRDGRTAIARDLPELYEAQQQGWTLEPPAWASLLRKPAPAAAAPVPVPEIPAEKAKRRTA